MSEAPYELELPPMDDLRPVSAAVAIEVHQAMWRPDYPRVEVKPE